MLKALLPFFYLAIVVCVINVFLCTLIWAIWAAWRNK
jgi:hypothetical protein